MSSFTRPALQVYPCLELLKLFLDQKPFLVSWLDQELFLRLLPNYKPLLNLNMFLVL